MENPEYKKNHRIQSKVTHERKRVTRWNWNSSASPLNALQHISCELTFNFKVSEWRAPTKEIISQQHSTTEIKAGLIKSIQHLTCAQWMNYAQWIVMRTQFVCGISRVQLKSIRSVKGDVDYNWNINQSRKKNFFHLKLWFSSCRSILG